jgi:hypothetical protein
MILYANLHIFAMVLQANLHIFAMVLQANLQRYTLAVSQEAMPWATKDGVREYPHRALLDECSESSEPTRLNDNDYY